MKQNCPIKKHTKRDMLNAAAALDINPADYPELLAGMNVELEHCDISEGNAVLSARIAMAHLRENPNYYAKLKQAKL